MRHQLKTGLSFGLTSGIITTLGLMTGLYAGTHSKLAVIGGVLIIAIADAMSDAFGVHISEESENVHSGREIWQSTFFTFLFKFIVALTFVAPILIFSLRNAIIASIIWGLSLLAIFSFYIAKNGKDRAWKIVAEHLVIASAVIIITNYIGIWIEKIFK